MMLIADSGSTNTTWVLSEGKGPIQTLQTGGMNPFFYSDKLIREEIEKNLMPKLEQEPDTLFFYGSGCKAQEIVPG